PDPGGLRHRRSVLRGDQTVRRATRQAGRGWLLSGRARRRVLARAIARRIELVGVVARRLAGHAFCLDHGMEGSVTVHMAAPAMKIWELVSDVRNTGRFSPEVFESEWLDGATGPALGARFRGHVKRNEIGPVYWTTCRVTHCEPGHEFAFDVLIGDKPANHWHYKFVES